MTEETTYNPEIGLPPVSEASRPSDLNDSSEKDIALRVFKADYEVAKTANDAEKNRREESYELYRAMGDGKEAERPGRSRIKSSDVMDMIEWLMPSLMKAFFGSNKAISVTPIGSEDVGKAEKLERLINWQFVDKGNGFRVGHEWIKSSLIYGTSPIKITWQDVYVTKGFDIPEVLEPQFEELRDDDTVETLMAESTRVEEIPAALTPQIYNGISYPMQPSEVSAMRIYENVHGEKRVKVYSGPLVEVVPPEDFFIDPEARDVADARFVIHRVKRTISYLKQKEKEGIYSDISSVIEKGISKSGSSAETDTETSMRANAANDYSFQTSRNDIQIARRKVDVFEWWGLLDPTESGIAEPYLVVVCNNVIIRMEKNPYAHGEAPFEVMRPILDVFTINGVSVVDLVGEYQKMKTALLRQTLDNISFQNNQQWLVDENAGVDIDALVKPRPGKVIFTNNMNGLKQIAPTPLENSVFNIIEFVQGQLEQRTGITRYNQGLDSKSLNKTATGINAMMSAGSQRIELIARVMSETGFRKLYKKMIALNQQFVDQNLVIRVYNEPIEISPDDLAGNFDVSVDIGGATNKDSETVQQLMTIMNYSNILLQLGVMLPNNIYEIVKKILSIWEIQDADKFVTDPNDTNILRQIVMGINQLQMIVEQGQPIDTQQVYMALLQARDALARMTMTDVSKENPQPGVAPNEKGGAAGKGDMTAYSNGTIPGGPGGKEE